MALGYDDGSIMIKLGREEPAMSMDTNGKIIWAKHSEIQQANLKTITGEINFGCSTRGCEDGLVASLNTKLNCYGTMRPFFNLFTSSPGLKTIGKHEKYAIFRSPQLRIIRKHEEFAIFRSPGLITICKHEEFAIFRSVAIW